MTTILPFPPQDPPAPRAWSCHCGKCSVLAKCWNCGQPRPAGEVDGDGGRVYNDNAPEAPRLGGNNQDEAPSGPLEAVVKGKHVNSAHSWAGLSAPSDEGFQPGFSPVSIGRSANGPMAFKGVSA